MSARSAPPEFIKELYLNVKDTSVLSGAIDSNGVIKRYQIADVGFKAGGDGSDWVGSRGGGGSTVVPEPGGVRLFSAGMLLVAAKVRRS